MEEKRGLSLIDQTNTLTDEFDFSRRKFLGIAAAAGIAVAACSQGEAPPVAKSVTKMVPGPDIAPDGLGWVNANYVIPSNTENLPVTESQYCP